VAESIMIDPRSYIDATVRAGFAWGERDCLLWLAGWAREVTGRDGGAEWRGRYRTAIGCARVLKRSGGMMACVERGASVAGMRRTDEPKAGDVGLVMAMTERGPAEVGAIYTGLRWAALTVGGVMTVRAEPIAAWTF
jgi:hypothetical protein